MGNLRLEINQKWALPWVCQDYNDWKTEHPTEVAALLDIHRMYRKYRQDHPAEPHDVLIASNQGEVPKQIIERLQSLAHGQTNFVNNEGYAAEMEEIDQKDFYNSYPGLEKKDYIVPISLEAVEFDTNFDLENPDHRLLPKVKFAAAVFSFDITLSPEALKYKEEKRFLGLWVDYNTVIAGCWYDYREMGATWEYTE